MGGWGYHQVVHCGIAVVAVGVKRTSRYRNGHGIQTYTHGNEICGMNSNTHGRLLIRFTCSSLSGTPPVLLDI